jgi:hypothetical protein
LLAAIDRAAAKGIKSRVKKTLKQRKNSLEFDDISLAPITRD